MFIVDLMDGLLCGMIDVVVYLFKDFFVDDELGLVVVVVFFCVVVNDVFLVWFGL